MAYIGPGTQSYNFTHMYDQVDLRGCSPKTDGCKGGLMNTLLIHKDFSEFAAIVKKAKLETIFNSPQADFTVFVPDNKAIQRQYHNFASKINISEAQHIVKSLTLKNRITYDLLKDSPMATYTTRDFPNNLTVMNVNGRTIVTNCSERCAGESANLIHADILCKNGIIHVIDNVLYPIESIQLR